MLGIAIRWLISMIRDIFAKKSLEEKLGRKVGSHEIYSIGANIEAAEAASDRPAMPRQQLAPREPMSRTKKGLLATVGLGFIVLLGAGLVVVVIGSMSTATYNRLNPFTPKTPMEAFPNPIAGWNRLDEPFYMSSAGSDYYGFSSSYRHDKTSIAYTLYVFKAAEDAQKRMTGRYFIGGTPVVKEKTDSRQVIVDSKTGTTAIEFVNGTKLIHIGASNITEAIEFENALPYAALGMEQPPKHVVPSDVQPASKIVTK